MLAWHPFNGGSASPKEYHSTYYSVSITLCGYLVHHHDQLGRVHAAAQGLQLRRQLHGGDRAAVVRVDEGEDFFHQDRKVDLVVAVYRGGVDVVVVV